MTGANKPVPGRARISRSNRRAGKAGYAWLSLWFCRVLFVARGPWAPADARSSLRPLFNQEGSIDTGLGREALRERGAMPSLFDRSSGQCGRRSLNGADAERRAAISGVVGVVVFCG